MSNSEDQYTGGSCSGGASGGASSSHAKKELGLLQKAVQHIEEEAERMPIDPSVHKSIQIVQQFIKNTRSICYGGTAINTILPPAARFYKPSDIPDYDFYNPDAVNQAKKLADILYKNGFVSVAKAGVHVNTYKVYANFIAVADITFMDLTLFKELEKRAIKKNGIMFADPDFLRMAMYAELSRPKGDLSRWEKVQTRLDLLNQHFPLLPPVDCPNDFMESIPFVSMDESNTSTDINQTEIETKDKAQDKEKEKDKTQWWKLLDTCIKNNAVFFGGFAAHTFKSRAEFKGPLEIFHSSPNQLIHKLQKQVFDGIVRIYPAIGEIVPMCYELINSNGQVCCAAYQIHNCYNYNEAVFHGRPIRVATIDTIMTLTLALSYADYSQNRREREIMDWRRRRMLCMAHFIFEQHRLNRGSTKGLTQRFTNTCVGPQETLTDILKNKHEVYNKMKKGNVSKDEYDKYFLNYVPESAASNKIKQKSKKRITKPQPHHPNKKTKKRASPKTLAGYLLR